MPSISRFVLAAAALACGLSAVSSPCYAQSASSADTAVRPFKARVPQADLDDLKQRIQATRWPDRETDASQGVPLAKLQQLVAYWGQQYDWRKAEAKLNVLPQFLTNIDGVEIHFIHVRSRHQNALPVIVTHGWPGSVFEQLKILGPLTDPTAHGGSAADAFDVVIPSLPGFGFSARPTTTGWGPDRIAQAWGELMKRLGYSRYVAQGGDWGSPVSNAMGRQAPHGLLGIHVNLPGTLPPEIGAALASGIAPAELSAKERAEFDRLLAAARMGNRAYVTMMAARPQDIGYGITDSPAGLAAWLLGHPGFRKWNYGDDPGQLPTRDDVLDNITLYWLTNTGASAARIYWENGARGPTSATDQRSQEIKLPVAVTVFPDEVYRSPESWARRAYPNLIYFNEAKSGGHFAAWEEPGIFSAELRAAFQSLRK